MNLIDSYILTHHEQLSSSELAERIGIDMSAVQYRKQVILSRLKKMENYVRPVTLDDEIVGLLKLIEERQTGWAVDVAKQRLIDLNKLSNV